MEDMIVGEGLHKSFYSRQRHRRVDAVAGISLRVRRGETYGLIGPDGAGKSTVQRLLNGLYVPDKGHAGVGGYDTVRQLNALHRLCGYMAQRFALYGDLTVVENLRFFGRAHGLTRQQAEERIPRLLRFAGLESFPRRLAAQLSGGMKKKLALATMLIHEPQVLFLDEPTLGVDPVSRREFWDLLATLRAERGVTILVCTPYMDEAERCHTVGLIYDGRIVAEDSPRHLRALVPGEMLELDVADLAAQELLSRAEGVLEVQSYGRLLRVFVDDATARSHDLVRLLQGASIPVRSLRRAEPGMEEAFVHLITARRREAQER